jgi:basic membrane protein A
LRVGIAYDIGGRGDMSFNDSAAAGLDEAIRKLCVTAREETVTIQNAKARSARLQVLDSIQLSRLVLSMQAQFRK